MQSCDWTSNASPSRLHYELTNESPQDKMRFKINAKHKLATKSSIILRCFIVKAKCVAAKQQKFLPTADCKCTRKEIPSETVKNLTCHGRRACGSAIKPYAQLVEQTAPRERRRSESEMRSRRKCLGQQHLGGASWARRSTKAEARWEIF